MIHVDGDVENLDLSIENDQHFGSQEDQVNFDYWPLDWNEKIVAFVAICFLGIGTYFSFDAVSALQPHFFIDLQIDPGKFSLVYSLSQWSHVIFGLINGFIIDKFLGLRNSAVLFALIALVGHFIFATSIFFNCFLFSLVGKVILGFSADSLGTIQNFYTVRYFSGKNFNMFLGIHLTTLRLGSVFSLLFQEKLYIFLGKSLGIHGPKLLGLTLHSATLVISIGLFFSLILYKIDKKHEKLFAKKKSPSSVSASWKKRDSLKNILHDIISIDVKIWHGVAILIFFYNGLSFYHQGVNYLSAKYHMSLSNAGQVLSLVDLISAFLAPVIGLIADKYRNNIFLAQLGITLCFFSLAMMNFTFISPLLCIIFLGVGFSSLSSSLWPYLIINTPINKMGTVSGIISSIRSLVSGIVISCSGYALEKYGFYFTNTLFIFSLIFAFTLNTNFLAIHGNGF